MTQGGLSHLKNKEIIAMELNSYKQSKHLSQKISGKI